MGGCVGKGVRRTVRRRDTSRVWTIVYIKERLVNSRGSALGTIVALKVTKRTSRIAKKANSTHVGKAIVTETASSTSGVTKYIQTRAIRAFVVISPETLRTLDVTATASSIVQKIVSWTRVEARRVQKTKP